MGWFEAEYLLWWVRDSQIPTLVGHTPTSELTDGDALIDTINPLFGGTDPLDFGALSGLRLSGGTYFDDEGTVGWNFSFFQLERGDDGATFASNGDPIVGQTFFDPTQNRNIIALASLPAISVGPLAPGLRRGSVNVVANNRFWGAELNSRSQMPAIYFADRLELLVGVRHLQYGEGISVSSHSEPFPGNPGAFVIDSRDSFTVSNKFWGPQIGLVSKTFIDDRFSIDMVGKVALGNMHEVVKIGGTTTLGPLGAPGTTTAGGILAQRTNSGRFVNDEFAVVSEFTINAGVQVCSCARLKVGYNILYASRVVRAGEQIDAVDARTVQSLASFDPTVQTTSPMFLREASSQFWAQGLNVTMELAY